MSYYNFCVIITKEVKHQLIFLDNSQLENKK